MSFLNFLGGFAVFNVVCDMFSGKRKQVSPESEPYYSRHDWGDYPECEFGGASDTDIDDLQGRIDELEDRLADFDRMSDRYDEIQDRIDELHDQLDDLEDQRSLYEDYQDEIEELRDELVDLEFERDLCDDSDDW